MTVPGLDTAELLERCSPEQISKGALKFLEFAQLQLSFHISPYLSSRKHQRRGEEMFSSAGNVCTWVIPTSFSKDFPWHGAGISSHHRCPSNSSSCEFPPSPFKWGLFLLTPHLWSGSCSLHVPLGSSCSIPAPLPALLPLCQGVPQGTLRHRNGTSKLQQEVWAC